MADGRRGGDGARTQLMSREKRVANRTAASAPDIVVITGLSGSGMSSATNAFEDPGYFCVDNLPLTLLPTFARLVQPEDEEVEDTEARIKRAALVINIREGHFLNEFERQLKKLKRASGWSSYCSLKPDDVLSDASARRAARTG